MEFEKFKQWINDIISDNTYASDYHGESIDIEFVSEKDFDKHCKEFYDEIKIELNKEHLLVLNRMTDVLEKIEVNLRR